MVEMEEKGFDPSKHLVNIKGGREYLPVAARIVWFREEFPISEGWAIHTALVDGGFREEYAVYRAEIIDPTGRIVATGTNVEDKRGFGDFLQKAETGAIGRALASCGYGTMAALDEGEVVDAPVERGQRGRAPVQYGHPHEVKLGDPEVIPYTCQECGKDLEIESARWSQRNLNGRTICGTCRAPMLESMKAAKEQKAAASEAPQAEKPPLACQDCGQIVDERVANAGLQGLGRIICIDCGRALKAKKDLATEATSN